MNNEAVVLLHGIWCNRAITALLGRRLERCGYQVHRFGYPSVRRSPAQNAADLNGFAAQIDAPKVHFVGHSLGGLVIVQLLHEYPERHPGRVVLLGTPLNGSRNARKLARIPGGRRMLGRSLEQGLLEGTGPSWPPECEVGMVAGSVGFGLGLFVGGLGEPGDGVVAIGETRLPALTDHCIVRTTHTGLLFSASAARQVCRFLRRGRFSRPASGPSR